MSLNRAEYRSTKPKKRDKLRGPILRASDFQDRCIQPLCHPSTRITKASGFVAGPTRRFSTERRVRPNADGGSSPCSSRHALLELGQCVAWASSLDPGARQVLLASEVGNTRASAGRRGRSSRAPRKRLGPSDPRPALCDGAPQRNPRRRAVAFNPDVPGKPAKSKGRRDT